MSPSSTACAVCFSSLEEIEASLIKSPDLWTPGSCSRYYQRCYRLLAHAKRSSTVLPAALQAKSYFRWLHSARSRLRGHPFDPLSAPCGSHEWIRKVLCFPRNFVVLELHDAHSVGRLAVICQDEFGDPKITASNDSSDSKPLFARLTSALVLYVASTAGSLA